MQELFGAATTEASADPWWTSGAFVLGLATVSVVSLVVTIWALLMTYRPRPVVPQVSYFTENIALVDPKVHASGIKVLDAANNVLATATMTTLIVRNTGRAVLKGEELVAGRPDFPEGLVLSFAKSPPPRVLRASIESEDAPYIAAQASVVVINGQQHVLVEFSLLEPGDEVQVAVLHDGESDDEAELVTHLPGGSIVKRSPDGFRPAFEFRWSVPLPWPLVGEFRYIPKSERRT